MAILKAVGAGHGNKSLRKVIKYITRDDKTRADLIGGYNLDPANAYDEMTATKRQWHKMGGRAYKHFVLSFSPTDGITPDEALMIAAELIEKTRLFCDFEVLYAVHADQDHIHVHLVVNSVSIVDGHKFRYAKNALEDLKTLSNEIVAAHGYGTAQNIDTNNVTAWNRDLYQVLADAHDGKRSSWMYDTATAVQAAMAAADKATFIRELESHGYVVRWGNRSVTYVAPCGKKVRASRLEDIFKLPSIRERYADREEEQEQLRRDILYARESVYKEPRIHRKDVYTEYDGTIYDRDKARHNSVKSDYIADSSAADTAETAAYSVPPRNACIEMDMYNDPDSDMPDDELRAAALIYGQAQFAAGTMRGYLAAHGYDMSIHNGSIYLHTPRGYTVKITSALDDLKGLEKIGSVSIYSSGYMTEKTKRISTLKGDDIAALAADALTDEADPVDILAHLIGKGVRIQHKDCDGKTDYELISGSDRIMLSEVFMALGIETEFPDDIPLPVAEIDDKVADDQEVPFEVPAAQTASRSDQENLADLLHAVQQAAAAADRDTFADELETLGYRTRWTSGGTLTFITSGGRHIRASRLEKRFNLPSIAAAYGQDRHVPVQGARYDAAQIIRQAMAECSDRQEFDSALISAGYTIAWKADESDASITAPGGQRMRLSSLDRTFGLSASVREEETNGVQSTAESGTENIELEELRSAINAARSSVAPEAAEKANKAATRSDSRTGKSNRTTQNGRRESSRSSYARDRGTQNRGHQSSMER